MNLQLTLNILSKPWAIDSKFLGANSHLIMNALKGVDSNMKMDGSTVSVFHSNTYSPSEWDKVPFADAKEGSIALINLSGVLMNQDQFCGPVGLNTISKWIDYAEANQNISGLILNIDSPGGVAMGPEAFANKIRNFSKPTVSFVSHMAASAAYYIGSAADKVILSGNSAMVGSIGTMWTFANASKMLKKKGIEIKEVFATKSVDKNKSINEALEGRNENLKAEILDPLNEVFLSAVRESRSEINEDALTGKVFFGNNAIEMGLADEVGTMQDAIAYINKNSKTVQSNKNSFSMKNKYPKVTAALGSEIESTDKGVYLNEEQLALVEAALETGTIQSTIDELATANTTIETVTAERDTAQASLKTEKEAVVSITASRDEWEAKAVKYGAEPSSEGAAPAAASEEIENENPHGYARQDDGLSALANG